MAFQLENFTALKQNYDGSGLFYYHETVSPTKDDPTSGRKGNTIAEITAKGFFDPVIDQLAIGSVIIVSTIAACNLYVVTALTDTTTTGQGESAVTVTKSTVTLTKAS